MTKKEEVKNGIFTYVSSNGSDDWEKFKFHYRDGNLERIEKHFKEGGIAIYIDEALGGMKQIIQDRELWKKQVDETIEQRKLMTNEERIKQVSQ